MIKALLDRRRPPAILRLIIAIWIDAIDGVMRRRSTAHVGQKDFVGVAPSLANRNATRAVVPIADMLRVIAAGLHAFPNFVFCRALPASRFTVDLGRDTGSGAFTPETTAGFRSASVHGARTNKLQISAITPAHPQSGAFVANGNEPSKALIWTYHLRHFNILRQERYAVIARFAQRAQMEALSADTVPLQAGVRADRLGRGCLDAGNRGDQVGEGDRGTAGRGGLRHRDY